MKHRIEVAPELNIHHVWYHKTDYRGRVERHFRNNVGFLIPTPVSNHNQVHRALWNGPPKPTKDEMIDCMDFMEESHESFKVDRFWGPEAAMKFFIIKEFENEEETDRYHEIRHHLAKQIGILSRRLTGVELPTVEELYAYGKAA